MVWPEGLENNFKGNKGRSKKISEKSCYEENRINHLTYYAWETREKNGKGEETRNKGRYKTTNEKKKKKKKRMATSVVAQ